jgi:hypothetical protein
MEPNDANDVHKNKNKITRTKAKTTSRTTTTTTNKSSYCCCNSLMDDDTKAWKK